MWNVEYFNLSHFESPLGLGSSKVESITKWPQSASIMNFQSSLWEISVYSRRLKTDITLEKKMENLCMT